MSGYERDRRSKIVGLIVLLAITLTALALTLIQPYFEAQSYNRLTGAHVTTWDAIWLDLRVQESPK